MGGEYPQAFADLVLRGRPFFSLSDFHEKLSVALDMDLHNVEDLWPPEFVGITSDYFQLQLEVTLGESRLRIDSILGRHERNEPLVISRTVFRVPALLNNPDNENLMQAGFCEQEVSS